MAFGREIVCKSNALRVKTLLKPNDIGSKITTTNQMKNELTTKQKQALNEMVQRRMQNTGEPEATAKEHIRNYLMKGLKG